MSTRRASSMASHILRKRSLQASISNSLIKASQSHITNSSQRHFSEEVKKTGFFSKIVGFFKDEASHLNELGEAIEGAPRVPKRRLLDPNVIPYCPPELLKAEEDALGHTVDFDNMDLSEKPEGEEEEEEEKGPNALAKTADSRTVWGRRVDTLKDKFHNSQMYRKANKARFNIEHSDNPHVQKLMDMRYDMQDKVDDLSQAYETSQHPLIWKIKDAEDKLTAETEQGMAYSEMLKKDPAFNQIDLLDDLQNYMVPVVISAFNRGDIDIIRSAMADQALDAVTVHIGDRIKKKEFWADQILNVAHLDVSAIEIENHEPVVKIVFVCQQVSCIKNEKDEITKGHEGNIVSTFYAWSITRDFVNPDFDWKIIDFRYQDMLGLE